MSSLHIGRTAVLAAFVSSTAVAQEIKPEEVVVTATALGETARDIAQPTAVVSGDQLRRQLEGTIGETLAREPGVSASYFGPSASRPIVRGLGGERVLMLHDGMPALDVSSLSQDHAVSIEPVLAQQVEILKGPATLLYGSGAVGGAINIVDGRLPYSLGAAENSGAAEVRGSTALEERTAVGRLDLGGEAVRVHASAFRRDTEDAEIPGYAFSRREREEHALEEPDEEFARGHLENSDSESRGGAFGVSTGGERGHVGVAWGRFETNYGVPAGHGEEEHGEEEEHEEDHGDEHEAEHQVRIDMQQDRYDLSGLRQLDGSFDAIRVRGTYSRYTHQELEGLEVGTQFEQDAYEVRLNLDHADLAGWRGTWGTQLTRLDFVARGEEAFVPPSETTHNSLFALEKRSFGPFSIEIGGRLEQQRIEPEHAPSSRYDELAYSLSSGVVWTATDDYALSMQVTRSQRHPQAAELYANGAHLAIGRYEIGDPRLEPETAHTADLTLHRHAEAGMHWSVGAFYNDFADFIYARGTDESIDGLQVFRYTQEDARLSGFEAELTVPFSIAETSLVELRFAGDYVRGRLAGGGDLPQMPPLRFGVELHYERGPLHFGLETYRYEAQRKTGPSERPTDAYTMTDADVSYRFGWGAGRVLAFVRGSNLLDEDARRHSSPLKEIAPLPGRSLHMGLRAEF